MEPSVLAPKKPKPPKWWVLVTLASGVLGVFAGMAAFGRGTYEISPFVVELAARPAPAGKTEFQIKPDVADVVPGYAEAGTHAGPIAFRGTVTGIGAPLATSDITDASSPAGFADFMTANGKAAMRAFALKLALVSLGGALVFGAAISMGRWQRIVGSLVAGLLTLTTVGALVAATYDTSEFSKTQFRRDTTLPGTLPGGLTTP